MKYLYMLTILIICCQCSNNSETKISFDTNYVGNEIHVYECNNRGKFLVKEFFNDGTKNVYLWNKFIDSNFTFLRFDSTGRVNVYGNYINSLAEGEFNYYYKSQLVEKRWYEKGVNVGVQFFETQKINTKHYEWCFIPNVYRNNEYDYLVSNIKYKVFLKKKLNEFRLIDFVYSLNNKERKGEVIDDENILIDLSDVKNGTYTLAYKYNFSEEYESLKEKKIKKGLAKGEIILKVRAGSSHYVNALK